MYTTPVGLRPGTVAATHLNRVEQLSEESSPFQSFTLPSDSGLVFTLAGWLLCTVNDIHDQYGYPWYASVRTCFETTCGVYSQVGP